MEGPNRGNRLHIDFVVHFVWLFVVRVFHQGQFIQFISLKLAFSTILARLYDA